MEERWIPLSVPNLKGNEVRYVTEALTSEWVSTAGRYVDEFEERIKGYVHTSGAVSCQNGTSGLHTALLVCGVRRGDAVIVPTLTFIAAVNPVKYIGAEPIFMDCDDSLCMDPLKLAAFCEEECDFVDGRLWERPSGREIKAVVIVHVFGNMADMERLLEIANTYRLKVVEDATEALGTYYTEGMYKGAYAGTMGDIGVYSFNGNKIITTGGGGMLVSDSQEYVARARHLTTQAKSDGLYYTHDEVGYNYRMTNIQAAMGLAQLEQLEAFIRIKEEHYAGYAKAFEEESGFHILPFREGTRSNRWFYALLCSGGMTKRDALINKLAASRIQSRPVWGLISDQLPYRNCRAYRIERARQYWSTIVNIPCSSNLSLEEQEKVIRCIKEG